MGVARTRTTVGVPRAARGRMSTFGHALVPAFVTSDRRVRPRGPSGPGSEEALGRFGGVLRVGVEHRGDPVREPVELLPGQYARHLQITVGRSEERRVGEESRT